MSNFFEIIGFVEDIADLSQESSLLEEHADKVIAILEKVQMREITYPEVMPLLNEALEEVQALVMVGKPEQREDAISCLHFYGLLHALLKSDEAEIMQEYGEKREPLE